MKKEKITTYKKVGEIKKEIVFKIPKVKLITYTLKAVIPTGQYANVQPELTVQASSLEEANAYLAPHLEKLHKDYFMYLERPKPIEVKKTDHFDKPQTFVENKRTQSVLPTLAVPTNEDSLEDLVDYLGNDIPASEYISEPFRKAKDAINACKNMEAIKMIGDKIDKSVKLKEEEKKMLLTIYNDKLIELNG